MTLVVAFGYESRSGKGECCDSIYKTFSEAHGGRLYILRLSFAQKLRDEIHAAMFDRWEQDEGTPYPGHAQALEHLCKWAGVPYDPDALADELNPYGKQRRLQQWWGTEYRREQFSQTYWLDAIAEVIDTKHPDVVLIDDLRFPNEFDFVQERFGFTVKVDRIGFTGLKGAAAGHVSEHALSGHQFDYEIAVEDGQLPALKKEALVVFEDILRTVTH